jgi:hypothetical protein
MLTDLNNNENNEIIKNQNNNNRSIFKKVELEIKTNLSQEIKAVKNEKNIKLPFIRLNREILGRKMNHIQKFCDSIYSNYNNNHTIVGIYNKDGDKQMKDILNDSKLKAIDDIQHYFFINKFPNEVNFRKKTLNELNERIKKIRSKIKPLSLNRIKNKRNNIQDEEKFTLITTINVPKEKIEEKYLNKNLISSYSNKKQKYNFGDYAVNKMVTKHPLVYKLNIDVNRKNNLPKIHRRNKIFNDVVELSKFIPDNTEIKKENKINNYDDYMKLKELKIIK